MDRIKHRTKHLVLRPPSSLSNGKPLKYDEVSDFVTQASSLTRLLRHDLATTTALLENSYAENHRLQKQNRQLACRRTDRGLLESVEAVAATERDDLNEQTS
jgi:hypothetical protein